LRTLEKFAIIKFSQLKPVLQYGMGALSWLNPPMHERLPTLLLRQYCKVLCRWALFYKTAACSRKGQQITK